MFKKKLFLDLDGVFSDFDQHYNDLFNQSNKEIKDNVMWKNIHSYDKWWTEMPKMKTFDQLWDIVKIYNPTILTGCPPSKFNHASEGKKEWCKKHFGENVPVITCLSRDKYKHMTQEGDILIDDMEKNCKKWEDNGGIAIRFDLEHIDLIIDEIKQLMIEY